MTGSLFRDPVIAEDGHTYERSSLELWFQMHNNVSPKTQAAMSQTVYPAYAIRELIKIYCYEKIDRSSF